LTIVRPELWSNDFLEYDYIGAPWMYSDTSYITDEGEHVPVGNGGFCLRSKKFLEMPTKLGLKLDHRQGFYNHDELINNEMSVYLSTISKKCIQKTHHNSTCHI
jgi:hypothetical protein